jgi:photosystem II stability/assembly factor-like uncharacterized protein
MALPLPAAAQQWQPVGPDGGSVRSLAFDPRNPDRVFLGTSAGRVYLSTDNGANWTRFAHLGSSSEMVLDHIVVDPSNSRNIFAAGWNAQLPDRDGEVFRTRDGGKSWDIIADMHGKSVRALSLAPSDPTILVAGTLEGIFRSRDGGDNWERISPEKNAEIRNVESIAIDPVNPEIIYAGTWHLPWKTEDGGRTWHNIKKGVIDDSDVFSIVVDSVKPANVYISACSGIYRSETGGELFKKIQGIPYAARRTRMLRMDPADHSVVYAGTTEGLWKTTDAGTVWKRTTNDAVIINDVLVDPRNPSRVLLATERGGVLASNDGGLTFAASNRGFTHRQVGALLVDPNNPAQIYAGLLNDKEFGGVYLSRDNGHSWTQFNEGLGGRDIFVLRRTTEGTLVAGTDRGLFRLDRDSPIWAPVAILAAPKPARISKNRSSFSQSAGLETGMRVTAMEIAGMRWYVAANSALFVSADAGQSWKKQELPNLKTVISLVVADKMVVAAGPNAIAVSVNAGESWLAPKPLPQDFLINSAAVDSTGTIWLAAREGIFRSSDVGDTWKRVTSLRLSNVMSIQFDEENQSIFATGAASMNVYQSMDNGRSWSAINSGWMLRNVSSVRGHLIGATPFDGVVIQPEAAAPPTISTAAVR